MIRASFLFITTLLCLLACSDKKDDLSGNWRAELYLQNDTLPFNFRLIDSAGIKIYLINAEEELLVEDINLNGDSLIIPMHIFDTEIRTEVRDGRMNGVFRKKYADNYILGFSAVKGPEYRFSSKPKTNLTVDGRWQVLFESSLEDSTYSIGEFTQKGSWLKGTFLTETGDYRFLEGELEGRKLKLSCFDR